MHTGIRKKTRKLILMDERLKRAYEKDEISKAEFEEKHEIISSKLRALKGEEMRMRREEKDRLLAELLGLRESLREGVIDDDSYARRFTDIQRRLELLEYPDRDLSNASMEKREEYIMLNGILFLSFVVPALFALLLNLPMGFFYWMVIVWVHEAGHGFWCILGNRLLCAFGGVLNEMLFTAVPAFICFKRKEIYLGGCILLMCAGMSIQYSGVYMQSAENPHGTSFAGALTGRYGDMTEQTHDWSIIFGEIGLIGDSYQLGELTEEAGHGLAVIFLTTSILAAFLGAYGWQPRELTNVVGGGAIFSLLYFGLSGTNGVEIIISLLLSTPLIKTALIRYL